MKTEANSADKRVKSGDRKTAIIIYGIATAHKCEVKLHKHLNHFAGRAGTSKNGQNLRSQIKQEKFSKSFKDEKVFNIIC
jgi:hypothetical protein